MKVTVTDVNRKEVALTEVTVGARLMYIVVDTESDQWNIVDPFMVISLPAQPTKLDAMLTIVHALAPANTPKD